MTAASVRSDTKRSAVAWLRKWPALVLLAIALVFFTNEYIAYRRAKPPNANCTLAELVEAVPPPARLAIVPQHGVQRLVWIGPISWLTVRSGPPCYVFDERGQLVDWCPETGEGWALDYLKVAAYEEQSISLDEAVRWCNEHNHASASARLQSRPSRE